MKKIAIVFAQPSPYRVDLIAYLQNTYTHYEFCFFYGESVGTRDWDVGIEKLSSHKRVKLKWLKVKAFGDIRTIVYSSAVTEPLNDYNPDVVIASEYNAIALDALKWARKHKKPYISWTDGTPYSERNINKIQKLQRKYVIKYAEAYIASSSKSKEVQMSYGAESSKIWTSLLTVDINKYLVERKTGSTPTLVFVGSLIERKGLDLLIAALSKITDIPYKVLVAGDGTEKGKYIQQAEQAGIMDRMKFLGFVTGSEMKHIYAQSDIFVMPTREDCFGLVLVEAMCAGLPILVSKYADGAYEVVEEGVNGQIFDPYDVESTAKLLADSLTNMERMKNWGAESLKRVGRFSLDNVAAPILEAIDYVLQGENEHEA